MNAKVSVLFTCVEAITYLLLYNLHDSTFNQDFLYKQVRESHSDFFFYEADSLKTSIVL